MTYLSINGQLDNAYYDFDGNLLVTFKISEAWSKRKALQIPKNELLELKVKEYKTNRSVEQNKLMWELLTILASHTHNDVDSLYEMALKRAKIQTEIIYVSKVVEESVLRETFRSVERLRDVEHINADGSKTTMIPYRVYIGSSKFNTKEMNQLIETIQLMMSEQGICVPINL